ncbi:fluoride efflux transporter CrcB [Arsenicicoccus sp. oral taxon 190]|uniref:fluoride efflux transporter CrcB n=1 Tax=Arsenicicoccus sp. oral taxon 190 TaxID=1658671 RepID=UPI00067A0C16|nr:fluoride efflux transporter CrcB [Arsenicicoccus sp. oral taxon 190]AKT52288.1 chromosome condensation protein CrcB [Arsenicicoccus sp. oral taxon 190]
MTPLVFLGVAVGGGVGAALRFVLDGWVRARARSAFPDGFPVGTVLINVTGSALLGLVYGLAARHALGAGWALALGAGVCGGYTTFSTASLETVRLAADGRSAAALLNGLGTLVVSVLAAAAGLWLAAL